MKLPRFLRSRRSRPHSPDDKMTLIEHMAELRTRLIRSTLAVLAGGIAGWFLYYPLINAFITPYRTVCRQHPTKFKCADGLVITDPLSGLLTHFKIAAYLGFVIALPVVLWQVWRFITPGLYPREKKFALPFLISSVALFAAGAWVAYWIFPYAIEFLIGVGGSKVQALFALDKYVSLITILMIAFGLGFEFPILLIFLEIAGVVTPQALARWRRYAIVLIFVVVAVGTPSGDPYSLFALAIPMCVFYEASIIIGRLLQRAKRRREIAAKAAASGPATT